MGVWPWLIFLTLLLAVYVVIVFGYLIPGRASISFMVLIVLILSCALYMIYRKVQTIDSRWGKGARAEQTVGRELDKLHRDGFHVFHDYKPENVGNVDHFIVGPTGIFVVETKSCTGEITSDGTGLFLDGKRLKSNDPVSQVKGEAKQIHELLEETCGINRWVRPILCYSDADVRCHDLVCGVEVVMPGALGRVVMSYAKRGGRLSESEIRAISKMLQRKIGESPSAAPGSPPKSRGWLRRNLSPDRIFLAVFAIFLLLVSVAFAGNTAAMLDSFANLYRAFDAPVSARL